MQVSRVALMAFLTVGDGLLLEPRAHLAGLSPLGVDDLAGKVLVSSILAEFQDDLGNVNRT
jgi:hypothetical protein